MDIQLQQGEVLCVSSVAKECRVVCGSGILWVTQEGNPRDYFIRCGEGRAFTPGGRLIIEARQQATLTVRENDVPARSQAPLRMSFCTAK